MGTESTTPTNDRIDSRHSTPNEVTLYDQTRDTLRDHRHALSRLANDLGHTYDRTTVQELRRVVFGPPLDRLSNRAHAGESIPSMDVTIDASEAYLLLVAHERCRDRYHEWGYEDLEERSNQYVYLLGNALQRDAQTFYDAVCDVRR